MEIRILGPADADALYALRRQALTEAPLAFAASPEDDLASSPDAVREILDRGPDSVVFGAFNDGLVAMLGLYRETKRKMAHKVFLWGAYVRPEARGQGLGHGLLASALAHARTIEGVTQAQISVSDAADTARALYERQGFQVWGTEPDAIQYAGRSVSEQHMVLSLTDG